MNEEEEEEVEEEMESSTGANDLKGKERMSR